MLLGYPNAKEEGKDSKLLPKIGFAHSDQSNRKFDSPDFASYLD